MLIEIQLTAKPHFSLYFRVIGAISVSAASLADAGLLSQSTYAEFMDMSDIQVLWLNNAFDLFSSGVRSRFQLLEERAAKKGEYSPFVVQALHYIEDHYKRANKPRICRRSNWHISRPLDAPHVKRESKKACAYFNRIIELKKAKELLNKPHMTIREVSQECGYQDPNYFARLFRRITGLTPREYAARAVKGGKADG